MSNKFDLKTRVAIKSHVGVYPNHQVGTVIAHTDGERNHVVEFPYNSCYKMKGEDLLSEEDAKVLQTEMAAKQAKLEAEFETVRLQIKEKLDQASALIQESQQIAHDHKKDISNLYPENSDLVSVLSDVGWISSNANC